LQAFIGCDRQHQRTRDVSDDRTLNAEDVSPLFVKRIGPVDMIIACADQLDRQVDSVACLPHTAYQ
jgi:hypothetical protein